MESGARTRSRFQWKDAQGVLRVGGLLLPRRFTPGTPVPLVIQAYHYYPQFFLPDGPHSSSDAAQALVAKGMVVFQIESMDVGLSSQQEGREFVQRLDTASRP